MIKSKVLLLTPLVAMLAGAFGQGCGTEASPKSNSGSGGSVSAGGGAGGSVDVGGGGSSATGGGNGGATVSTSHRITIVGSGT